MKYEIVPMSHYRTDPKLDLSIPILLKKLSKPIEFKWTPPKMYIVTSDDRKFEDETEATMHQIDLDADREAEFYRIERQEKAWYKFTRALMIPSKYFNK